MRVPEAPLRQAWAHAVRDPLDPRAPADPGRQATRLDDGTVLLVRIDQDESGRWARVTVHRDAPALSHEDAVPLAAEAFLHGRFEPFPVESLAGADGRTWHYLIDLGRYKDAHAERLLRGARGVLGAGAPEEELHFAARQMACPFPMLAACVDPGKAAARDARTVQFLSDRFHLPESWVEELVEDFFAAQREGQIDATGKPLDGG